MKTAIRFLDLLFCHGADEFSRVLKELNDPIIEVPAARPWVRALQPYALSSGLWRTTGLLTPYSLHVYPSPVAEEAMRMSKLVGRRRKFPVSRAGLENLHAALLGLGRSSIRSDSVNFGSRVFTLPRHGSVPLLLDRLFALQAKQAQANSIALGLVTAVAILLIHPFADGNGRLARASLGMIGDRAGSGCHVPLAIPFVMQASNKLLLAITRAVDACCLGPVTQCFSRSADSCALLDQEIRQHSINYTRECDGLLGGVSSRVRNLLAGSTTLSDQVFIRCLARCPRSARAHIEAKMYTATIGSKGVKWVNSMCLKQMDRLLPLMFKLV